MKTLEIVAREGIALPMALQRLFTDWSTTHTASYTIYTIKLDYLGDEHIIPLNNAYSVCQIVHWSCEGETVFDYVHDITLN